VILLVVAWYAYAKVYSDIHAGSISAVEIRPIWKLDKDTISATFKSMQVWYRNGTYHAKYFLILSALLFLGTVFMRKMADPFLYSLNILVVLGALSFSILFFRSMRNHDYYQINNLFLFIPLYLTVFSIILNSWPQLYRSIWMKMLLSGVILLLVLNAGEHMRKRYSDRDMHYVSSSETLRMFNIEEYLNNIGITREDKVYCTPDRSMNISLYLTNRKGLTDFSPLSKLTLQERLERMKGIGIEYVILGSREPYLEEENLDEMLGQKIGEIGGTEIFRLE
jgi:hypothetical protein